MGVIKLTMVGRRNAIIPSLQLDCLIDSMTNYWHRKYLIAV
jgi:hypothetical protein